MAIGISVKLFPLTLALASGALLPAEEVAGLPLHLSKLNPKTIRVWLGDHVSSTAQVAFATKDGIVVVDTVGNPALDKELRKVIARELGRKDFRYLINTHEHGDHTYGNAVYADCTIVGHARCEEGMKPAPGQRERINGWISDAIKEKEAKLAKEAAGSPQAKRLQEELILDKLGLANHQSDPVLKPPTKTFRDRMTLNCGDTTFEMFFTGGMHSASDISIMVPEHGLLLTGDTMSDKWLTDTPGCLASFMVREEVPHDFPLLLENWKLILARKDKIKEFIPGHWNGTLSLKGYEARSAYIETLWKGVNAAVKDGKTLDNIFAEFPLRTRFPELVDSPGITPQNHGQTLLGLWADITKTASAARKIADLLEAGAPEDQIKQVIAARGANPPRFYYLENQFNGLAYWLMQNNQLPKAMVMFKANLELFPNSWNAYDSLAEACLKAGDRQKASELYSKSVELNPNNKNGKDALDKLRQSGS